MRDSSGNAVAIIGTPAANRSQRAHAVDGFAASQQGAWFGLLASTSTRAITTT